MITNAFPRFQSRGTFDEVDAAAARVIRSIESDELHDWIVRQAVHESARETVARYSEVGA